MTDEITMPSHGMWEVNVDARFVDGKRYTYSAVIEAPPTASLAEVMDKAQPLRLDRPSGYKPVTINVDTTMGHPDNREAGKEVAAIIDRYRTERRTPSRWYRRRR